MAGSLQDQLLKAGLTTEKKAKKAKKSSKKTRDLKRAVKAATEEKRSSEQQKAKELNAQIKQQANEKAIKAQIKQLIETNKLELGGTLTYNFTFENKVKQLDVNEKVQRQLANGLLSIVNLESEFYVVPSVVADKIAQRDDSYLINTQVTEEVDEDDPYKDYVIPDDLMW
jgi:uncharacterized protein YaiL (DUF2058 family)